jgi:hypothetical protein
MFATTFNKAAKTNFVSKLSSYNIAHSILGLLFVGVVLIIGGIISEVHNEIELLNQGGNAFAAYQDLLHAAAIDSISHYVSTGMLGNLPSAGGNMQAWGIALCFVFSPLVAIVMLAMRAIAERATKRTWNFAAA